MGVLPDVQCLHQGVTEKSLNKGVVGELVLHHPEKSQGVSTLLVSVDSRGQDRRLLFIGRRRTEEDVTKDNQTLSLIKKQFHCGPTMMLNAGAQTLGPGTPFFIQKPFPFSCLFVQSLS